MLRCIVLHCIASVHLPSAFCPRVLTTRFTSLAIISHAIRPSLPSCLFVPSYLCAIPFKHRHPVWATPSGPFTREEADPAMFSISSMPSMHDGDHPGETLADESARPKHSRCPAKLTSPSACRTGSFYGDGRLPGLCIKLLPAAPILH